MVDVFIVGEYLEVVGFVFGYVYEVWIVCFFGLVLVGEVCFFIVWNELIVCFIFWFDVVFIMGIVKLEKFVFIFDD